MFEVAERYELIAKRGESSWRRAASGQESIDAMDHRTEILVKLIRERLTASRNLLAHLRGEIAADEQLIAHSKVAIAESLRLLAKPIDGD